LCRRDVNTFIEYTTTDQDGNPVVQQGFHREWHHLIDENESVLIGAPRSHGKSAQMCGRCVWEIGNNCNIRIKILGAADEKAKELLSVVRVQIASNPRVREVFPELEIDTSLGDTQGKFFVKRNVIQRDPTCEASGVFATGAGGRADILLCDDVVDPQNAIINPAMRERVKTVMSETWFSLVAVSGKIIWICTPYHVDDASHAYKASSAWTVWWIPAIREEEVVDEETGEPILDEEGKPIVCEIILWPGFWSKERLEKRRGVIGDRAYTRQFLLRAMSDDERMFPDSYLEKSYNPDLANIGEDIEADWKTFGGIDLASALGKKAKYTVIVTLAKSPTTGKLRIKQIWRRKAKFPAIMAAIVEQHEEHQWVRLYVESNQYQIAVYDALQEDQKQITVEPFNTGRNKADEELGLPGLSLAFERSEFEIPSARFPLAADEKSDLADLMRELQNYPGGETTDIIMALWFAWRAAKEGTADFVDAYIDSVGA
jgi:Terminase RNaseH-like domain